MSDIVERLHTLARGDHDRDCQGREYHCGCGFDEQAWKAADEAADLIEALTAELAEARDGKDRLMIAAAASVKASMDEYKRGHADGVKSGREEGFEKASEAVCGYIHPAYGELPGEPFASAAIRALKSPKPQED